MLGPSNVILVLFLSSAVFCTEEHEVIPGSIIKHLPILEKSYSINVDINLTTIKAKWSNILYATSGGNVSNPRIRPPAIFVRKNSTNIFIFSSLNGNTKHFINNSLPLGEYVNIRIRQAKRFDGKYQHMVLINSQKIFSAVNLMPMVFENVTYFASKPRLPSANALIKNLRIQTPIPDTYFKSYRGQLVRFIRKLHPSYQFTFTINPLGYVSNQSTILRVTNTQNNCCNHGDRIPALFYAPNSTDLFIQNAINGDGNQLVSQTIPLHHTTYVTIQQQKLREGRYRYSVSLNNTEIYHAINYRFMSYENVTVWMGDAFHPAANAIVDRFEYQSPMPALDFQHHPSRNTFYSEIPYISKKYQFEFEIKPNIAYPYLANTLFVTTQQQQRRKNLPITIVSFQPNSSALKIFHHAFYKHPSFSRGIKRDRFTRVRIMQYLDIKNKYRYSIYFNNVEVFSLINTQAREFFDAVVYFGAPRGRAATSSIIRNFSFKNL